MYLWCVEVPLAGAASSNHPLLSSTEAKYMACTHATQKAIWLHQLLDQLRFKQIAPTDLLGDNQGAIALVKNPSDHPHTKHIALQYHFIHFAIDDGHILLDYIHTSEMAADGLTKSLGGEKHSLFLCMFSLQPCLSGSVKSWYYIYIHGLFIYTQTLQCLPNHSFTFLKLLHHSSAFIPFRMLRSEFLQSLYLTPTVSLVTI